VEVFRAVDGAMTVRVGDDTQDVSDRGDADVEVPPGVIRGFVAIGDGTLVVDVDLLFTPPRPRRRG
jgi:mannose-6-phosphate isomerase-like protein (cupin superfamily)